MALQQVIASIVTLSLVCMVAAEGMGATPGDVISLFRRPKRLLKAVVAVNVVVPVAAAIIIELFPLTPLARGGIIVMAVSPVPPFVPGKERRAGGKLDYSLGVYAALSLLSVIIVPVTVEIVSDLSGVEVALSPLAVLRTVAVSVLLPLAIGLALRRWRPSLAERLAAPLNRLAAIILALVLVPLLVVIWPQVMPLAGNGTILAMALITAIALFGGHMLGGPDPAHRGALAVAAATRHPGIALMIANAAGFKATPAIVAFMLVGVVVAIPYQLWLKRSAAQAAASMRPS
jgi:BASS family bile acid:Na+ symporter